MEIKLTTAERLKDLRVCERNLTLEQLSEQTGLSRSALGNYETKDGAELSPNAVVTLAKFYGVSADYLLGLTENRVHSDTDIAQLHLSDDAVGILKNNRLNTRLLSELICHPAFLRLLTDIEVCVDRIADMQFRDRNLLLEQARQMIIDRYDPPAHDLGLRTLELAQGSEDLFYSHVIHNDLDEIVRDIRTAHTSDATTADAKTEMENMFELMQPILQEALDYEGTADAKRAFLICRTLDINYNMLPEEDQQAFARVCKRSPKLRNIISQRGKAGRLPPTQKRKRK